MPYYLLLYIEQLKKKLGLAKSDPSQRTYQKSIAEPQPDPTIFGRSQQSKTLGQATHNLSLSNITRPEPS